MIITKETDYALRILRVLLDGEKHSVAEMSETELIPNQFAYQILRKLSAGNLVRVSRGALGGCALSCDLDATSLYDLMGVVGERGILCACMEPGYECRWQDKHGRCEMILDNVTILPQNSCNRDIREMRANELKLKIREPEITAFVEEGYKVYDADGNLKEKKEDILIAAEDQAAKLKELEGCEIYSIEQEKGVYTVSIDTEDHTFMIKVSGSADAEEWDRFLSKD